MALRVFPVVPLVKSDTREFFETLDSKGLHQLLSMYTKH